MAIDTTKPLVLMGGAPSFTGAVYSDPAETTPESILSATEEVLRKMYPVGAIYMSVNSADPADLFGFGTWERVKDRFLLAAGDSYAAGSTGGEATHTLTIAEMPSHSHKGYVEYGTNSNLNHPVPGQYNQINFTYHVEEYHQTFIEDTGGNLAHNNMPPYLAVYIWKRTA